MSAGAYNLYYDLETRVQHRASRSRRSHSTRRRCHRAQVHIIEARELAAKDYGGTSDPVAFVEMDFGDHQQKQTGPRVTIQQTQMQNAGLCVPDARAVVPAQVYTTAVGSLENDTLRSEEAYLKRAPSSK